MQKVKSRGLIRVGMISMETLIRLQNAGYTVAIVWGVK